ncbi:Transcription factor [Coemansia sp. IMI 203386]|nr:Transcription factor [Coemansia sp. IMI 203386]
MATMHKRRTSKLSLEPNPFEHSFSLVRSEDVKAITEEAGCGVNGSVVRATAVKEQLTGSSDKTPQSADQWCSADQGATSVSPGSSNSSSALHNKVKLPPVTAINGPMHAADMTGEWGESLRSGPLSPAMLGGPAAVNTAKVAAKVTPRLGLTDPVLHTGLTPFIMGEVQPVVASGGFDCMKLPSSLATPGIQAIIKAAIEGQEISTTPGGSLRISSSASTANVGAASVAASAAACLSSSSTSTLQASADPAGVSSSMVSVRHQVIPLPSMALTAPPQVAATMAMQGLASSHQSQPLSVEPMSTQIVPLSADTVNEPAPKAIVLPTTTSASIITVEGSGSGAKNGSKKTKRRKPVAVDNGVAPPKQKKKRTRLNNSDKPTVAQAQRESSTESRTAVEKSAVEGTDAEDNNNNNVAENAQNDDDDEKRQQFLERNRIAALKCRQRKKKQLKELQERHDFISMQNEALRADYLKLREVSLNLRALLVAHRECPVAQANGVYGIDNLPIGTPAVSLQPLLFNSSAEGEQAKEIIAAIPPANNGVPVHSVDPSTGKPIVMGIPQHQQSAVDMFVGPQTVNATGVALPMIPQSVIVDPKTRISMGPQFMAMNN